MPLKLIGAGYPRTGTNSLQLVLEKLFGGRCYHMNELFEKPDHAPIWDAATQGKLPVWQEFFADYEAAVDWPSSLFWESQAEAFPDAPILLSTRKDAETWFGSVIKTIVPAVQQSEDSPWRKMACALFEKGVHVTDIHQPDKETMMAAYEAHNDYVRKTVPASRLIEWQPQDGWKPICDALNIPVPDEPFPHVNSREEFAARIGSDVPAPKT